MPFGVPHDHLIVRADITLLDCRYFPQIRWLHLILFWCRDRKNHEDAWKDYVELCRAGGSRSFVDLVKLANLRSPFEDGCVASVIDEIALFLDSVDDSSF